MWPESGQLIKAGGALSICRTIVNQHGGTIWAEPNPSGGTVFCFTVPAVLAAKAA